MTILEKFRFPTILGLSVLMVGLVAGVYLTMQNQVLTSRAASENSPRDITITNIEASSATISWQTTSPSPGFITFINGSANQTVIDDRDKVTPSARSPHHVTLANLSPETTYQFKVVSGKFQTAPQEFQTGKQQTPNGFKPIIGSVLDGENPLIGGIVYLQINNVILESSVVKNLGNFIIPLSNLTPVIGSQAELIVISEDGKGASATFNIKDDDHLIGPLKIGQDLDSTDALGVSTEDINGDGVVNSFDLIKKAINK